MYVQVTQDPVRWIRNCSVRFSTFSVVAFRNRGAFVSTEGKRLLHVRFSLYVFARHMHLFRISVLNVVYVSFALEVFTMLLSSFKNGLRCVTHTHTHTHACTHARTHAHAHTRLTTLCPVSRYPKGKTNLDFTEASGIEWQWYQLGHTQVCISLQTDNYAPTTQFLQAGCPSCHPTNSVKALKATRDVKGKRKSKVRERDNEGRNLHP